MSETYKFLIIDTYYQSFLSSLYGTVPDLGKKGYSDQMEVIMSQCFGTADFYSKNLRKLGHEAEDIIPNNEILQRQWATENNFKVNDSFFVRAAKHVPYFRNKFFEHNVLMDILSAQIRKIRPDVLYMQDLSFCPPDFLRFMKEYVRVIVGQIACPMVNKNLLRPFDLIVSSLPHYVELFRSLGKKSELLKIAFESSILEKIVPAEMKYDVVHIGGYGPVHNERNLLLEEIAEKIDIKFWGYGVDNLNGNSIIRTNYSGECWGIDRYQIFSQSKIVVTKHITSVAGNFCNNMTLYEATGSGALLVTDDKENLKEIFVPGKEVVAYKNAGDAAEKIRYYLEHEEQRAKIARAGQKRTLTEHTYYNRMAELINIIGKYLR